MGNLFDWVLQGGAKDRRRAGFLRGSAILEDGNGRPGRCGHDGQQ